MTEKPQPFSCRLFACRGPSAARPGLEELQVYFKNDSSTALESVILEKIGFEWADVGRYKDEGHDLGAVPPGGLVPVWRHDDASPEVRMDAWLRIRWAAGQQRLLFEFGKLYMYREGLAVIPELGRPGRIARSEVLAG